MITRRTFLHGIATACLTGPAVPFEKVAELLEQVVVNSTPSAKSVRECIAFAPDVLAMIDRVICEQNIEGYVLRMGLTGVDTAYRKFLDLRPDDTGPDDVTERIGPVVVVVDRDSLCLLRGTTVELHEDATTAQDSGTLQVCSPLLPCGCSRCRAERDAS